MPTQRKQIFQVGNRVYELVLVEGPIYRDGQSFAAQFDHDAGVLRVSKRVPRDQRAWVTAVAVSDACFRLWNPIPLIYPDWRPDPPACGPSRPGPEDDPPCP